MYKVPSSDYGHSTTVHSTLVQCLVYALWPPLHGDPVVQVSSYLSAKNINIYQTTYI